MAKAWSQDWGSRLRRERERRGWSREQLAERIKAGAHSIYRWEDGRDTPRPEARERLVTAFGKPEEAWGRWIGNVPYLRNLYFTGRERILARLHTALNQRTILVVSQRRALSGLGGIGKTQTAVEYAYRYGEEYDLVLWVRADSREALLAQFAGLASLFDLPNQAETDQSRLAQAVKRHLETQEERVWLLIFDNVDDLQMVKAFLPERGNGAILLTTRLQAVGTHMRKIELDTLSQEESLQFLLERTRADEDQEGTALSAAEHQAAEQICRLLDGLPLALDQAAAYIEERGCSLAEYVTLYQQQRAAFLRLRNQIDPEDYPDSVATTWRLSFQRVEAQEPAAADLLRLCAYLAPDAIPEELFTAGAATLGPVLAPVAATGAELDPAIEALRAYSLVQRHPHEHTFSLHRLVQAVVQDAQDEAEQRLWARRALLLVNAAFPEEGPETWPQCERLLSHALQVTQVIEQQQAECEEVGQVLWRAASYLQARGRPAELESLYLRVHRIYEQQVGPEHPLVAHSLYRLGTVYRYRGKYAEAERFCRRALTMYEQQLGPEHSDVAGALNSLAIFYEELGRYTEAEPLYLRALSIWEQQLGPSHDRTATALYNVAELYRKQHRFAEAEALYQRALRIWEQQFGPEHSRLAYPLAGLGDLAREQGQDAEAEPLYLRAQRLWEDSFGPEYPELPYALTGLAALYRERGQFAEAEALYQRVLSIHEQRGPENHWLASPLTGLAALYREQGRFEKAESLYLSALRIWQQPPGERHPEQAETMHGLARLREAQGTYEEARSWYAQALAVRGQALGTQHPKTRQTRQRLIALLHAQGQHEEAARLEVDPAPPGTEKTAQAGLPEDEQQDTPQSGSVSGQHLSENT